MTIAPAACFAPIVTPSTRLLILGSLPGVESLRRQEYYGHPRNHFWRLISDVVGTDMVALDYSDRLECLRANAIGLWDVIAQATRPGSLDQNIRDAVPNGLMEMVETLPQLRAIAFNGITAYRLGSAQIAHYVPDMPKVLTFISLPSSSPANTMRYHYKAQAWSALSQYLG